jgi:hypothetical protein
MKTFALLSIALGSLAVACAPPTSIYITPTGGDTDLSASAQKNRVPRHRVRACEIKSLASWGFRPEGSLPTVGVEEI